MTFHLVNRSQQDPLITDETAPQHVLVAASEAQHLAPSSSKRSNEKRIEDQKKFGIYFDDDYDYLQHLRDSEKQEVVWEQVEPRNAVKEKAEPKLKLPSSVFASEFEEDEGLLRRGNQVRGPRPDWDPDIVEALDDDFDFENPDNQLDDDFITQAMVSGEEDNEESDVDSYDADYSDEDEDQLAPLRGFGREETKSRFTEYSMSSSVIRRNEQLTLLDDKFEKFYEQYDDLEVGALDAEEIQGTIDSNNELLLQFASEFSKDHKTIPYEKSYDIARLVKLQQEYESEPEDIVELEVTESKKKWDCESILSTYSNIYNHPKVIEEPPTKRKISIDAKGLPKDTLGTGSKLTAKSLAKLGQPAAAAPQSPGGAKSLCAESVLSTLSVLSIRPKDETVEERKERKKLLKEYRAERRIERKANTEAFKKEKVRQDQIAANLRNNLQGRKLL